MGPNSYQEHWIRAPPDDVNTFDQCAFFGTRFRSCYKAVLPGGGVSGPMAKSARCEASSPVTALSAFAFNHIVKTQRVYPESSSCTYTTNSQSLLQLEE